DGNQYSLSLKLFRLAHDRAPQRSLVSFAMPVMEALSKATEQSCHLSILDGAEVLVLAGVESPLSQRYSVRLGARLPVWESVTGNVLVSQLGEAASDRLFRDLTKTVDPERLSAFRKRVVRVRPTGGDRGPSYLVDGVISISRCVR